MEKSFTKKNGEKQKEKGERPKRGFKSRWEHYVFRMEKEFEILDKTGRKIYMSKKSWLHIAKKHPIMINYIEEIKETLKRPLKITDYSFDEGLRYYYSYIKDKKPPYNYLLVVVKYLNNEGLIITSYFEKQIK